MKLRPYQREAIDAVRAVYDDGVQNALVVLATGLGKALRNDQRVLTPYGWKPIGKIKVGDYAIGSNGLPTPVVGVFPQGVRPMRRVSFAGRTDVYCDPSHLWTVRVDWGRPVDLDTETIADTIATGLPVVSVGASSSAPLPHIARQPRKILAVEDAGEAEATCIKVAAADGLLVTEGYVLTHNTVLFCVLGREMRTEGVGKVLVLAHRDELLTQARDKWLAVDPGASVGIYQGDRRESWADVIFASVQSCYPDVLGEDGVTVKRKGRIHELPLSEIGLVVVDECHRLPAPTYGAIIASIREANPAALLLGVTATPARADGKGLGMYFDRVAYRMGIAEGIEQGYLAPVRGARVELQIDLSQVKTSKRTGDFDDEDLGRVLDTDSAREHIVAKWLEIVGPGTEDGGEHGRFTAAFSPTVAAAEHLAAEFERAGVKAGFVSGATKKKDRKRTLDAYQRGEIRVLCNVGVLTEGWDAPHTACVLMARPTKSGVLYRQAVGRGTRPAPGKADCLVMDCVGANALGLQTILDLSTPGADRVPGIDPEPEEEIVLDEGAQTDLDLGEEVEVRRIVGASVYEIDLFGGGVQWVKVNGCSVVTIDIGKALIVFPDVGDTRSVAIVQGRDVDYVVRRVPPKDAFRAGESVAMEIGVPRFLRPSAFYCRKPASEKQVTFLRTLVEITSKVAPIDLSAMPAPETQGAHQIQAWITYLNARLAIARAKAPPRVAAPA